MARAAFEALKVYQLSERLSDEVWALAIRWAPFARDTVGKQLVKAADSTGANIAEGFGRGSSKDNQRFVRMARGSLNETLHWLRRAYSRKLVSADVVSRLKPLVDELGPKLNAHLRGIGKNTRTGGPANRHPTTNHKQHTTNGSR